MSAPAGSSFAEAVKAAGLTMSGPNAVVVVRDADGTLRDLTAVPDVDTEVTAVPMSSPDGLAVLRHSTAHVMAQAVQDLFDEARLGIGPPIDNGFYYDFDVPKPFQAEDLERIQARMREIVKQGQRFRRRALTSREAARDELSAEPFKLELVDIKGEASGAAATEVGGGELTMYDNVDPRSGEVVWTDLCRGPHLPSTHLIPAFALLRNSAAYWRGDEKNPQLQRIYGTAWPTRPQLKEYLAALAEAARRDHRRIGEDLDLFAFSPEIGKGLPLWLPNGTIIRDELEGWARQTERRLGYRRVVTPHITQEDLYYLSGHLPYYSEDLYAPIQIEGENYYLKPMNCPHHHMVYKARPKSYRELPYKIAEYGTVYRFERSGQLHGLMRARGFTQNDAHIYCTREQAKEQFLEVMRMHDEYYRALGITDFYMVLALRDPANTTKYHDDAQMWEDAERITREAMDESGIPYIEELGGAAHYGPKVDFIIRSVTGKEFAASTNQVDLYTPQRFDLKYHDADGTDKQVVVIHRAPLGSHERFVAFLTEHFGGAFPVWLAPEQVRVIPIMPELDGYAETVSQALLDADVRVDVDASDGRLPARVRAAVTRKIPLIVVVGRREVEEGTVSVRDRSGQETSMPLADFLRRVRDLIDTRSLEGAGHLRAGSGATEVDTSD
nr:threonine--tRNA ligase [Frankia sp. QA3]